MEKAREINLKELVLALLQKWWLIVACAALGGVIAVVYTTQFVDPMYRADIMMYVNNSSQPTSSNVTTSADLSASQRLVRTYVNILKSNRVLDKVAERLDSDLSASQIKGMITAAALDETEVFRVRISHTDPQEAADIANAIAEVAQVEIASIVEGSSTKIIDYAKVPKEPFSPSKTRNTAVGLAVGIVVAAVAVVLSVLLDVRIKSEEDLQQISNLPVLGTIPDLAAEHRSDYRYGKNKYGYYSKEVKPE